MRRAIGLTELSLSRDVKGNKEGSYTDLSGERKIRWVFSSWKWVTCKSGIENAETLIDFFVSFLSSKCGFQESQGSGARLKNGSFQDVPLGQGKLEKTGYF